MNAFYDIDVAEKYGLNKSLISKWKKEFKSTEDTVAQNHKKVLKKIRPSTKHKELFKKLHQKFTGARSKGRKVSFAWFYANANKINREMHGNDSPRLQKSVVTRFMKYYKIKLRRVQRKETVNKLEY